MSTKTLVEEYAKVFTPEQVLESTFALFSSRLPPERNALKIGYYQNTIFCLKNNLQENIFYIEKDITSSAQSLSVICHLIRLSLAEPDSLSVILSSPREYKTKYPFYLAKTIEDMFEYPIIDFKKGRYENYRYKPKKTYKLLQYWSARSNWLVFQDFPDRVRELSAEKRKNMAKVLGLYEKGMNKKEIIEVLTYSQDRLPFS